MRWVLISGLLCGCASPGWSAENTSEMSTLTVSGVGIIRMAPDTAIVTLAVETAGESFDQVQQENSTTMQRVVDRILELGVKPERIQTTSFDITPQYAPRTPRPRPEERIPQTPKIIGYTARNTINVDVRDLNSLGRIVDGALSVGANRFSGVNWVLRNKDGVYLEALELASEKAQKKANTLSRALGVRLLRLATVQEGGVQTFPRSRALKSAQFNMEDSSNAVPMSPGEIQVQARVHLVFEIEKHHSQE